MPGGCVAVRFLGTHADFAQGFEEVRAALDAQGVTGALRYNAELVFEEITANIVEHGAPDRHELHVCVTLEVCADSIVLTFEDNGVPFDPRKRPDPPPQKSLEEARIGGYGLMLVRRAAQSIDYVRTPEGGNRVSVRLPRGEQEATR
jgi:anti-sigma regulatory factor (Ser/Thr protein kinase)